MQSYINCIKKISMKDLTEEQIESLKIFFGNKRIKDSYEISELQQKLQANIHHATKIAEKNTTKNNLGQVVIKSDDEWMKEDYWDEI